MEHVGQKDKKAKMGLLQTDELYKYILETSVFPREPQPLKELREATAKHPLAFLATAPDAGQFIDLLLKILNAKKTIEIGVFTGYSLLLTALSIPEDGKILALDVNRKSYEIGLPYIQKAGVEHKIDFVESQALPVLDKLLEDQENEGSFDFAFVDADRANFLNYHERLMKLLKIGGIVVYDNTLWGGTVVFSDVSLAPEPRRPDWKLAIEFNKALAADPRIEISQATLGDGITVCRRLY
uniref:Uncharacterized protein n=1 Tax=Davidia involucrata TaxID=16924 RepID=A0A5B7C2U1_DAVIN